MTESISRNVTISSGKFDKERDYWLNKLSGELSISAFPYDRHMSGLYQKKKESERFALPEEVNTKLIKISGASDVGIFIMLLTGLAYLLYRYTGNEDIIIGAPVLKQENQGNYLNNTLVLRNRVNGEMTFKDLLLQTRETVIEADENMNYPFAKIVKSLDLSSCDGGSSLFKTAVEFKSIHDECFPEGEKCDTVFSFSKTGNRIEYRITYNASFYKKETIVRLGKHFGNYFPAVTQNPLIKLSGIEMLSPVEKKEILSACNDTETDYPKQKTSLELFAEQKEKTPGAVAIVCEDKKLTYRELNDKSNRLARMLREEYGVLPGDIAGLYIARSLEMIVGILGILKAKAVSLPINLQYPKERIALILKDSAALIVIKSGQTDSRSFPRVKMVDAENEDINSYDEADIPGSGEPGNPAYIIYTSGSTGTPKGVTLSHAGIVNHLFAIIKELELRKEDIFCHNHNISYVVSIWQIFGPLIIGARLFIYPEHVISDPYELLKRVDKDRVSILEIVPSVLKYYLDLLAEGKDRIELRRLRLLILTGEKIPPALVNKYFERYRSDVINAYGQSEYSDDTLYFKIPYDTGTTTVPVGKPGSNTQVYILDKNGKPQPPGSPGELYVSGDGLALGYLNRLDLTAEKFLNHPFKPAERIFKTGDLVRWNSAGDIEFLGRIDHQVKIRGFRIEPGEIEEHILKYGQIEDVVVIAGEHTAGKEPGQKEDTYLCAYIATNKNIVVKELKEYLSRLLPGYMVPSKFVQLDRIPLNSNNKVDRNALPEPGFSGSEYYTAPGNDIENKLAGLWSDVLGIGKGDFGIDSSFFDLGGHSLKATTLISKIHEAFNTKLELSEIFKTPTIRELAEHIKVSVKERFTPIKKVEAKEFYALSAVQKRLYFLQRMDLNSTTYNLTSSVVIEGNLLVQGLAETFMTLMKRHESLRTAFLEVNGLPVQRIHKNVDVIVEYIEAGIKDQGSGIRQKQNNRTVETQTLASQEPEFNVGARRDVPGQFPSPGGVAEGRGGLGDPERRGEPAIDRFIRPFDLSQAPLLRIGLVELSQYEHILVLDMHHIITDGTSQSILIREFNTLTQGEQLSALNLQYKDFSGWQNGKEQQEYMKGQEKYWLNVFPGEIPVLNLPTDYPRPAVRSSAGGSVHFVLDKRETQNFKDISKNLQTTLYTSLLAVFNVLLAKLSGQEDIIVGVVLAARRHVQLEHITGMFVNTLAVRNYPAKEKTFREFLKDVAKQTIDAADNQDYQFEDLVNKISTNRDTGRNPVFDVMFVFQNLDFPEAEGSGFKISSYNYENNVSKFDLTLISFEKDEKLFFTLEYCPELFKRETIKRFIAYFEETATSIFADPGIKLSEVEIIPAKEKKRLLYDFNDTKVDYIKERTIQELFEMQVEKFPGKVAVVGPGIEEGNSGNKDRIQLTYKELDNMANRLAAVLGTLGVKTESICGLMIEHSIEMAVGILGILKIGGAYLPINLDCPLNRVYAMLKDSGAKVLLCRKPLPYKVNAQIAMLHLDNPALRIGAASNPGKRCFSNSIAYVIYTSGSTGHPKGVLIEHRNILNYVLWRIDKYKQSPKDASLQLVTVSFDGFASNFYPTLLSGGKVVLLNENKWGDVYYLRKSIKEEKVTHFSVVPSMYRIVLNKANQEDFEGVRFVVLAGEKADGNLIKKSRQLFPGLELINEYGPTENSVTTSANFGMTADNINVIGSPISNNFIYILDENRNLKPAGVPGELWISGGGLMRGYLNRPELTSGKMTLNPYRPLSKMYHTGDIAKWLPDGNIDFVGRIDEQVKVRGFRIEPGEVERYLLKHNEINEAIVIAYDDDNGSKYLCAYITAGKKFEIAELRQHLARELPYYMIPACFMQIERLPLTVNGKIDRKALPAPEVKTGSLFEAPRSERESRLAELWQEVLGVDKVGINDNFFELGGDSVNAIQIASRMLHYGFRLDIKNLFLQPTIKGLAKLLQRAGRKIDQGIVEGDVKLTPAQEWFFENEFSHKHHFNQVVILFKEDGFDERIVHKVFTKILEHHDALRMVFEEKESRIIQRNRGIEGKPVDLEIISVMDVENIESEIAKNCIRVQGGIDLKRGPLVKLGLLKTGNGDHLSIAIHRLVVDELSWRILAEDFSAGYEQAEAGKHVEFRLKTDSFKNWADKLKEYSESKELLNEISYWQAIDSTELETLPKDHDISTRRKKREDNHRIMIELDEEETGQLLNKANRAYNTETPDLLLTALGTALKEWRGIEKAAVHFERQERDFVIEGVDISRTIGWITSPFPLVLDMSRPEELSYRVKHVKEVLGRIPNKGIGYNILRYLTPPEKREGLTYRLKPEIRFSYSGEFEENVMKKGIVFQVPGMNKIDSTGFASELNYAIDIAGRAAGKRLCVTFSYNRHEYKKSSIEELGNFFRSFLLRITAHCTGKDKKELTPQDLTYSDFTIEELEELKNSLNRVG